MKYSVKADIYGAAGKVVIKKGEIIEGDEGKDAQLFEPLDFEVSTPSDDESAEESGDGKPKRGRPAK